MRLTAIVPFLFALSQPLDAAVAPSVPKIETWITEFSKVNPKTISAPSRLVLVKSFSDNSTASGMPIFFEFDHNQCRKLSFWVCPSFNEVRMASQINRRADSVGVAGAAKMSSADAVVYGVNNKVFFSNKDASFKQELQIGVGELANIEKLSKAVMQTLEYDGVVLDVKGDYLLVGSLKSKLENNESQGLLLASSAKAWSMKGVKRKGVGLVHMVEKSDGFAIFQQIISGKTAEPILVGTKLILEAKKATDSPK